MIWDDRLADADLSWPAGDLDRSWLDIGCQH
jgi:hypothetical protein